MCVFVRMQCDVTQNNLTECNARQPHVKDLQGSWGQGSNPHHAAHPAEQPRIPSPSEAVPPRSERTREPFSSVELSYQIKPGGVAGRPCEIFSTPMLKAAVEPEVS